MRTLLARFVAALILVAAVAGCAGTMQQDQTAIEWMERQYMSADE